MLAWLDYARIIEIFNVLVRSKIRTRHLPPSSLPNIVRIAMHIDIYGRSLNVHNAMWNIWQRYLDLLSI